MIELDRVSKTIGEKAIVDQISFTIERGEFCALVGPSGSGKSTTLRMINRLIEPSDGAIRIAGEDIATIPVEMLRRRLGYAIQSTGLFPHWNVADNIATVPRLLKWPESRVRERVDELLELVQLDAATSRTQYPHQLSGGQQQRVGVARALAADPDILLMDEPFGALDPITRQALRVELRRIHKATGKTILFVTHDIDEALTLAGRIAILRDGRLEQFGSPMEILARPATIFVRDFIGGAELGLKLLAQRRVGEQLHHDLKPAGEPIAPDMPMTEALSLMVLRGADQLPVKSADGSIAGGVTLADMVAPR
jgi:osmoprotectant transport system ATP-binding protein